MQSSSVLLRAKRENPCFKDVSQCVMKARHNEAQRPCSYLRRIKGGKKGRERERVGASGAEDDTTLQRLTQTPTDVPPFEMEIKRMI